MDVWEEFIRLLNNRSYLPEHPGREVLERLETAIRDDECSQIGAGFRNTRQQNLHDYLDKRVAKRSKK